MTTPMEIYMPEYLASLQLLKDERDRFESMMNDPSVADGPRAAAAAAYLDMEARIALFQDAHEAFQHRYGPATPGPSDAVVQQAVALHSALATYLANAGTQVGVMHSITSLVSGWGALSGAAIAGAPVAPAPTGQV